ncbi:MAG: carboxypeptidase regulatory-like domain-containing protein [Vicinamibacterales bacterium]
MKRWISGLLAVAFAAVTATSAFAQGGGASSTGTIQGKVTDAQGAVLPGVTVTATSSSALGAQTAVTSETGNYRFPALPPGSYTVTYELAGFNTVKREGIQLSLGFTANVNIELALATLQETVTVTGESPVIDTSATRIQQNFKTEQLQSIPNGRDMWSLLAVTPAVQMTRIDVGGNRAGTQTGYSAYGFTGQVRVLIEGINTTEGTGGAGFYFDYSSLEEVFLGTTGQTAEMPNPGVQSQFIAKSGGNTFSGEYYLDWYNNSLQGSNLPNNYTTPVAQGGFGFRKGANEIDHYYDTAINTGGPIKKDKIWWFGTYRQQKNAVAQPLFSFDKTFDTKLWNPVGKLTYQINQNNKMIGYYQWGQKLQPNRLPNGGYTYAKEGSTNKQNSGSWVYKAEWNGTVSDKLYLEARFGDFGYYFPLLANGTDNFYFRDTTNLTVDGSNQRWQLDRDRKQYNLASTYFIDTAKMGTHTFKAGMEVLREKGWEGYEQRFGGNIETTYANGVGNTVTFAFPTASGAVGSLDAHDSLTSKSALNVFGAFINDTWSWGKLTTNLGVRFDNYRGWLPEQNQLGFTNGPVTLAAKTFAEKDMYTWKSVAPRIGIIYDFSGQGRSVLKANYGLFWHNPGVGLGSDANPNIPEKIVTYNWTDTNGNRKYDPTDTLGAITTNQTEGSILFNSNIKQPYTHEAGLFFEQQITDTLGARVGYVYKTEDDLTGATFQGRPLSAYSVPFNYVDVGPDNVRGTSDDQNITLHGIPTASLANFPATQTIDNVPGRKSRYQTYEASLNKRFSQKWSGQLGGSWTKQKDFPEAVTASYPRNLDLPGLENRTFWSMKATASYEAPLGIRVSPVVRHQSGTNYARTIAVPGSAAPAGVTFPASTIYAEAADSRREQNIWVFDTRFERTFNVTNRIRFRGFLDFFNITNSHASETISRATGASFLRPTAILAPFTSRVGFRLLW